MSNIKMAINILEPFEKHNIKNIIELHPWMKDKKFLLLNNKEDIINFVNKVIEKKICAIDLETDSLNTRINSKGKCIANIIGVSLSCDINEGAYICIAHEEAEEYNVNIDFVMEQLKRIVDNCIVVFHNFKYDGEILRYYNIIIEDESKYEDTYLMTAVENSSRKEKGLKYLSKTLLKRPQLEFEEMSGEESDFSMVPPQKAVYYAAADAMNTLALYYYLEKSLNEQDPTKKEGPWFIYKVEKRCLFVTMEMERNLVKIDKKYIIEQNKEIDNKMKEIEDKIHKIAGQKFDINSTQQLGKILFEELNIPYPSEVEKTKTGSYQTNGEILEKIRDKNSIVEFILAYRSYAKVKSTYLENWLKNADENDEVKFQLNQVQTDTGRYSSTGGKGLNIDGYCGVNCQNIPTYDKNDPYAVNLRRAIIARPGYKIVSIDYSGEELRIATNFSKEEKWIHEFTEGSGDLHTVTARVITGKKEVTKEERKLAKTLNFLTLYGGGPASFSLQAKIPIETAKKIMSTFFKEYKGLNNWIKEECKRARKRKYSKTALGRRRPLDEFYNSEDESIQSKGDRCAINSAIQGTGADIIKIALWRVYKWIKDNKLQDDVRILMPIHDEILYEIKEDKLDIIIPELCDIMKLKDICKALGWIVPLEVDAEYGDSFDVDHNFWEEVKEKEQNKEGKKEDKKDEVQNNDNVQSKDEIAQETNTASAVSISEKSVISNKEAESIIDKYKEESTENDTITKDTIEKFIDLKDYYNHVVTINLETAYKLKFMFELLRSTNNLLIGPKKKICIIAKGGEVIYRTTEEFSVDAFTILTILFNI